MNKMNSVQGIRNLKNVLNKTQEGKKIFQDISRSKLDQIIGKNLEDSVTEQLKSGKFSHILEKGKNREIVKELLPTESFKRLEKLQKHVGELYESSQKFFNTSQSATAVADMSIIGNIIGGIALVFSGNPWGLLPLAGTVSANQLSKLIANPEFLRLVEEAINASKGNNIGMMNQVTSLMLDKIKEVLPKSAMASRFDLEGEK